MTVSHPDYTPLTDRCPDEVVTHVSRDVVTGPQGRKIAVLTLHNDSEKRPETLGPRSMQELLNAIDEVHRLAEDGSVDGVMIEGTAPTFAAGVDLTLVSTLAADPETPITAVGAMGHDFVESIRSMPVPTCARVNGTALGGGLELALAADYRIGHPGTKNIGLPEIRLGLIPGWTGVFALPRLIGPENSVRVIFHNPLNNGKSLTSQQAHEIGILDELTEAAVTDDDARNQALAWFEGVVRGEVVVDRPHETDQEEPLWAADSDEGGSLRERFEESVRAAEEIVQRKTSGASDAARVALEVFTNGPLESRKQSRERQISVLDELARGDQFSSSVYSMLELVQHRAKHPSMVPPEVEPAHIAKVGVVGAGLMASQLALLFLTRLQVPVIISDVDQARVDRGLDTISGELQKNVSKGRLAEEQAAHLRTLVSGTTDTADFADCDFVIEAVFEETQVKRDVFANLEKSVRTDCILATNTSSLLVSEMIEDLDHPERVIGFHFFNPVAVLPLVEIVRTDSTTDAAIATAFSLAKRLDKIAVGARDSSGFIVNRVLGVVLSEAGLALDRGASPESITEAYRPLGLPMDTFTLIDLVGLPIAVHLLESLERHQGDRFHVSEKFRTLNEHAISPLSDQKGGLSTEARELVGASNDDTVTQETLRTSVEGALASEISRMLDEGVVPDRQDIDLAMILGTGWPFFNGGITRYLDRVGAFERID
ncbi:3-hydroxyacyl-CoA dehydrogenase NAD-binding domain-containing protein [Kocuria massiliensis]|uniref:3-hydroxyacyl-CoA dehydrogenase NAD-binding domain-containing protein n=1 Tax=Kocuria massiliensis TaxID=1926282 RepID=UPI000A1CD702|nr:3-hydroxyacyl-CoA dehydrogenase NAD-binding domain-containing protein [Kocuria massiliensis]